MKTLHYDLGRRLRALAAVSMAVAGLATQIGASPGGTTASSDSCKDTCAVFGQDASLCVRACRRCYRGGDCFFVFFDGRVGYTWACTGCSYN